MIWESIGLMTVLDLAMIGMGTTFFVVLCRQLDRPRAKGFVAVGVGLAGFGLFYAADLLTMWVLPQLTSPSHATAALETLHLNYHWVITLSGTACILWGFTSVGRDLTDEITRRKKAEGALLENRERFEVAAEGANVGMWDWPDVNQDQEWWSPRWYELLGYADEEIEASYSNFKAMLHPDDDGRLAENVSAHVLSHEPFDMEYRLRTKSGDYRWFRAHGQSKLDSGGKAIRMSGSIQDITDRKHAEEGQRALDARLRETQKLESLGVLARGFAHDFNNLLTGVMGNASLALVTLPPTSPLRSQMEAIEQAASHGEELTQQLLAYAGEGKGVPERLDVTALVEATAPLLAATVPRRTKLAYDTQRGLPPIVGDATQIRQVLVNLVTNAADAIGATDGVVTVSTGTQRTSDSDGAMTSELAAKGICPYIDVSDTGLGVDESTQARMWDPFFSTKTSGRGDWGWRSFRVSCVHMGVGYESLAGLEPARRFASCLQQPPVRRRRLGCTGWAPP